MNEEQIEQLQAFYKSHSDLEFVKKVLEALRLGELSQDELVVIRNWVADQSKESPGTEKLKKG